MNTVAQYNNFIHEIIFQNVQSSKDGKVISN